MGESVQTSSSPLVTTGVVVDLAMTEVLRAIATSSQLESSSMVALVQCARQSVQAADHVAFTTVVTLRSHHPQLEFGAASDEVATATARAELAANAGPTFDAVARRTTVSTRTDVAPPCRSDDARPTSSGAGVRTTLAVPILDSEHGYSVAALTFSSRTPGALDSQDVVRAQTMAAMVAVALTSSRSRGQFDAALRSRDVIGQAKGMIMERYRVDDTRAFELLARLSQDSNTPLAAVAADLIAAENLADSAPTAEQTTG